MLETVRIKNLAIVDQTEIHFGTGLNIISGETGAGKSIVLQAISLLLGSRANTDWIRKGAQDAIVEGLFNIRDIPQVGDRLRKLGYEAKGSELLIRRLISSSGRHRVYLNGELSTLSILQEVCQGLVDLCGQHEHQSLLKPSIQLDLVDRYGGLQEKAIDLLRTFSRYRSLLSEEKVLIHSESERMKKIEFLDFQIKEIKNAQLKPNEDEELKKEKELLHSSESRLSRLGKVTQALESPTGIVESLRVLCSEMEALRTLDSQLSKQSEAAERIFIETEELLRELQDYCGSIDLNPDRLTEVRERLSVVAQLKRKFGGNVEDVLVHLADLQSERDSLDSLEGKLEKIKGELTELTAELKTQGAKLTKKRVRIAKVFSETVSEELGDLNMDGVLFHASVSEKKDLDQWSTRDGANRVEFLVRTNLGEDLKSIAKIASGGELSRIMLAIRRVIADKGGIGVYLFDEIDSGIGGQTAFQVGKKLKSVSEFNQVICITHLPQVAVFADQHLVVKKVTELGRTLTKVTELESLESKKEIARMLGGEKPSRKSIENAEELLRSANLS